MSPDPLSRLLVLLRGNPVTDADYTYRHGGLQIVLAVHLLLLGAAGLALGSWHVLAELAPVAGLLVLSARLRNPRLAATCVSLGLYGCSSVLVHLAGGATEAHFHFFVVLAMISLYRDALPYLVGILFVLVEHFVVGLLAPTAVFEHTGDVLMWALVHAGFVAAASIAQLSSWHAVEREHQDERHRLQAELERLAAVVDDAGVAIISEDLHGTIRSWNAAATALFGYPSSEAVGQPKRLLMPPGREHEVEENLAVVRAGGSRSYETQRVTADGQLLDVALVVSPVRGPKGEVLGASVMAQNITAHKAAEAALAERTEQLSRLAYRDPLTGLANRALFLEDLRAAHEGAQPGPAVLMLDLDGFKLVNDTAGHAAGDELLVQAARRLRSCVRPADTVARLGGDEFAVVLPGCDAALAAGRILEALRGVYDLEGRQVTVSASIGFAVRRADSSPESLLRDADVALYAAKASGKNCVLRYDEQMYSDMVRRTELESGLRTALRDQALELHYQPVVDLRTGKLAGFEALLRWEHPLQGSVSPAEFIPIAEQTGLIVPIGSWVLREATRQAARHIRSLGRPLRIAVNVSPRQLEQPDFPAVVRRALEQARLPASSLVLEVTESGLVDSAHTVTAALHAVRELGVLVAIDDFGTGYSSLDRLRTLPVDQLKVDRAFVSEIGDDGVVRSPVLAAIYAMAAALGLRTVGEGVETEAQYAALRALGGDEAQGYLMSRPLPASEAAELLAFAEPSARLGVAADVLPQELADVMRHVRAAAASEHPDEQAIGSLLRAVCEVTGFETAFLSTIDTRAGIQEFAFTHNAGAELVRPGERVPWSSSLCRAATATGRWTSSDVSGDYLLAGSPVRSYAGVPLLAADGSLRATLCAVDREGRTLGGRARETLAFLSRLIADELLPLSQGRRTVVVVDDSPVSRRLLEATLLALGPYEVVGRVGSVEQAVALCAAVRPDLVLLDVELPDSGGQAAVARVGAASPTSEIVVVSGSAGHRQAALAAGAVGFLTKDRVVNDLGLVLAPRQPLDAAAPEALLR